MTDKKSNSRALTGVIWLMLAAAPAGLAQEKPSLADELRTAIEAGGASAARQRFSEIYPEHKDDYAVDMQAMMMMATEYMQVGDAETAQAIADINTVIARDMVGAAMTTQPPGVAQQMEAVRRAEQEQATQARMDQEVVQPAQARAEERSDSRARDDLQRFTGLYGDPADTQANRQLWVAVSCDGFLVVGAMWGDVAPWWMRSGSDTAFSYADTFFSLALEFETGPDGRAVRLAHDLDALGSPLQHVGPLTGDFPECIERPMR